VRERHAPKGSPNLRRDMESIDHVTIRP
jgi:hypothetical protein